MDARLVPSIRWPIDLLYDGVCGLCDRFVRRRYRIFGRADVCKLPCDADHSRFLDR